MYNFTLVFVHFLSLLRRSSKRLQFCLGCVSLIGKLRNFTWFVARLFAKHAILHWLFEHSSQPVQFYIGFCTFNVICQRSSQHLQFYLGCLSIVDKLRTFTWFVAHFSRNMYFLSGRLNVIGNMCNFTLVLQIRRHLLAVERVGASSSTVNSDLGQLSTRICHL